MASPLLSNRSIKLAVAFPLFMKPKGLPKAKLAAIMSVYFVIFGLWCLRYLQMISKEKYFANKISIADSRQVVRLTPLIPVQSRRPRRRFIEEYPLQRQNTFYQSPFIIVPRSRLKTRVRALPLHGMEMRISSGHDGWTILMKGHFNRQLSSAPLTFLGTTYRHKREPSRTHSSDYTLA